MKSIALLTILLMMSLTWSCADDASLEDPINGDGEAEFQDENENEDDFGNEDEGFDDQGANANINSDVNSEFVDNEGQFNLGNNQDVLSEDDAVNFNNGEFLNNAMLQDQGDELLSQNGLDGQNNLFGQDQFLNQGQGQFFDNQGGQLQNNQGQLFGNQGQLQDNQGQLFGNQGQLQNNQGLFNNQGQQMFDNQGGEGINNALDNDFLQNDQNFLNAATDNTINDVVDGAAMGGGRVKYVLAGGSSLYDRPNGSVQGPLEKGDHPLVFNEGEWARTSDGYYIPNRDLTNAPVSRIKRKTGWIN